MQCQIYPMKKNLLPPITCLVNFFNKDKIIFILFQFIIIHVFIKSKKLMSFIYFVILIFKATTYELEIKLWSNALYLEILYIVLYHLVMRENVQLGLISTRLLSWQANYFRDSNKSDKTEHSLGILMLGRDYTGIRNRVHVFCDFILQAIWLINKHFVLFIDPMICYVWQEKKKK